MLAGDDQLTAGEHLHWTDCAVQAVLASTCTVLTVPRWPVSEL